MMGYTEHVQELDELLPEEKQRNISEDIYIHQTLSVKVKGKDH